MTVKTTLIAAGALVATAFAAAPAANAGDVDFRFVIGTPHAIGLGYVDHRDNRHYRHYRHAEPISYRGVHRILRRHGFHHIRDIDRRGPFYVARAEHRGGIYRVRIHAYTGRIVDRDLVRRSGQRHYGYGYGYGRGW